MTIREVCQGRGEWFCCRSMIKADQYNVWNYIRLKMIVKVINFENHTT